MSRISSHSPSSGATRTKRMAGRPPLALFGGESSDSPARMTPISDHSVLMIGTNRYKNRQWRCLTRSFDQRNWILSVLRQKDGYNNDDPGGHSGVFVFWRVCVFNFLVHSVLVAVCVVNASLIRHQRIHLIAQSRLAYTRPIGTSAVVGLFRKKRRKKEKKEREAKKKTETQSQRNTEYPLAVLLCLRAVSPSHVAQRLACLRTDRPLPQTGFVLGHSCTVKGGLTILFNRPALRKQCPFSRR